MTINSDQEINLFKKHLDPKQWNFIELTSNGEKDKNNWFLKSCAQKIQCDILVVSGHFGGTFFGDSGFRMSMEDLERNSCNADCSGILQKPKEVFLFGCNTLAGKEKDRRSPEEYVRVLIQDGFTAAQAQQVAAFRYSPLGNSFSTRMSQVFSKTPRIYGFTSIAPSGKNIEPLLNTYLKKTNLDYQNFDLINKTLNIKTNSLLMSTLSNTAISQATGSDVITQSNHEKPYCYLENDKVTRLQKISYIKQVLESGRTLTFIPYIKDYIHKIKNDQNYILSEEENEILISLKNNRKIAEDFQTILNTKEDVFLKIRADVFTLMKDLKIITVEYFNKNILQVLSINFNTSITFSLVDRICSLDIQVNISADLIRESEFIKMNTLNLLGCLKPQNSDIHQRLVRAMVNDNDSSLRRFAIRALGKIQPTDTGIHQKIAEVMLNDEDYTVRSEAVYALDEIQPSDTSIHQKIAEVMMDHKDPNLPYYAVQALRKIKPTDAGIHQKIAEVMIKNTDFGTRYQAAAALKEIKPTDIGVHQKIVQALVNDESSGVQEQAAAALKEIKPTDPDIHQKLAMASLNDKNPAVRYLARSVLNSMKPLSSSIIKYLNDNIDKAADRDLVLELLK